jgi:hypothetical protein
VVIATIEYIVNKFVDIHLFSNEGAKAFKYIAKARQRSQFYAHFDNAFLSHRRRHQLFAE